MSRQRQAVYLGTVLSDTIDIHRQQIRDPQLLLPEHSQQEGWVDQK